MFRINRLLFILLPLLILTSCSVSKRVERRGGYLLVRNAVKVDRPGISQSDLLNFAQPKPNKRFPAFIRTKVFVYDALKNRQKTKFNRWLIRNFGEPPVLLDTVMIHNSLVPMRQYLRNKGYFDAEVTSSYEIRRGKAKVVYSTHTSPPYMFSQIVRDINDDTIRKIVMRSESLIRSGGQYDAYLMTSERDRITQLLRNEGYYAFTSDYVFFEVDTIDKDKQADIKLIIASPPRGGVHSRYVFNNIFIHTDFPKPSDTLRTFDTLAWYGEVQADRIQQQPGSGAIPQDIDKSFNPVPRFYEIYRGRLRLRPEALSRSVFVKPGDYYSQKNVNLTYNRIQNMGLSSFVSINVKPPADTVINMPGSGLLDCEIRMTRAPVNGFTIDAEGTNEAGLMGLGASLSFRNRNIFVGAEGLRIRAYGGFEVTPSLIGDQENTQFGVFNSLEGGLETGIDFPTLLSPFIIKNLNQNARPRTTIGLGFNYAIRPEYERYLMKLSMSYEWNASPVSRHFLAPVDFSSVSIARSDTFTNRLLQLKDPRFLNQYTNHLILALKYSWIFNNQNLTDRSNFIFFRVNVEPAGNLFNLISNVSAAPRDEDGKYTLFKIRYAQYFRTDFDYRFYKPFSAKRRMVFRSAFGVGIPYGNSISLPFEKGFFAGGANGMRGWPVRSLGPGEYTSQDDNIFDNVGDLWAELNLEYRFPVYSFFHGAVFTDVGNIWLLKENTDFPGGKFEWNRLPRSLAADAGVGFRFDFSMFVFRIDGGLRIYNPGEPEGERFFRPGDFQLKQINWNFGIGYPF